MLHNNVYYTMLKYVLLKIPIINIMRKNTLICLFLCVCSLSLSACNTLAGLGRDLQSQNNKATTNNNYK